MAALLAGVFATTGVRDLSDLKNTFKPTLSRVQSLMYDEVVRRGWFRRSPQAQRGAWTTLGGLLVFVPVFVGIWLGSSVMSLGSSSGLGVPPGIALVAGCAGR